jgi:hypothetical protein
VDGDDEEAERGWLGSWIWLIIRVSPL